MPFTVNRNKISQNTMNNFSALGKTMALNVQPLLKSPFTDLLSSLGQHQYFSRCAEFEMSMMNCLEAYGADKGKIKCKDLIDDFKECHAQRKQIARENEMRMERHKQLFRGERAFKDHYAPPPKTDSY